jgi:hypothetical protein
VPPSQTHDLTFTDTEVRKRFVSWDRGEPGREWGCLTVLAAHAPGIAPLPLRQESEDGAPVVVMERLPGEPLGGGPLTPEQTAALGRTLRRMWDVPYDVLEATGLRERAYGPSSEAARVVGKWLSDDHDLTVLQEPDLVAQARAAALDWLARPGVTPAPHPTTIGIADLNPANVLWDGEVCRLVDFEDGGLSDVAYELADHVEHLAGRLPRVYDTDALVDAARLTPDEAARFAAYRPLWAAFWLAMLLPGNGGFRRNPPGTTEAQARHLLGLVG